MSPPSTDNIRKLLGNARALKVLYVESVLEDRELVIPVLSHFFGKITTATDAEEGFERFLQQPVDVVVTGDRLPKGSGVGLVRKLRSRSADLPILVHSRCLDPSTTLEYINLFVDGFLLKPTTTENLMGVLTRVVGSITVRKENLRIHNTLNRINSGELLSVEKKLEEMNNEYFNHWVTGLPNRASFLRDLNRGRSESTLFLVDIKRFKRINEIYGIRAGDMVLKRFSSFLKEYAEDYQCHVYHISADEFALLFDEVGTMEECHYLAQMLVFYTHNRKAIISINRTRIEITTMCNMGVAFKEKDPLQKANIALNHAMERNLPYSIYAKSFRKDLEQDETYTRILKEALSQDMVVPYFQPIVTTDGKKKYETLMRIVTPKRVISPHYFLDIAKKTGDYDTLTKIIVEKSFAFFQDRAVEFSINLSYQDATNRCLATFLADQIQHHEVADRLILEIVESESIENFTLIESFLKPFRELGVRVAIDDFGSGYSNFSNLLQLSPEYIKIDGSIIRNIDTDEKSLLIARTINNFAKSLGIQTIAEFIHCREVYEKAKALGVDGFQGFYLGSPAPTLS